MAERVQINLRIAVNTRKEKIGSGKNAKRASTITAIFCKLERFIIFKKYPPKRKTWKHSSPSLPLYTHKHIHTHGESGKQTMEKKNLSEISTTQQKNRKLVADFSLVGTILSCFKMYINLACDNALKVAISEKSLRNISVHIQYEYPKLLNRVKHLLLLLITNNHKYGFLI